MLGLASTTVAEACRVPRDWASASAGRSKPAPERVRTAAATLRIDLRSAAATLSSRLGSELISAHCYGTLRSTDSMSVCNAASYSYSRASDAIGEQIRRLF